jgi:hypothetical protein
MTFTLKLPGRRMVAAVTPHALVRYGERVRPHLIDREALHKDLCRVVEVCGSTSAAPPDWSNENWDGDTREDGDLFVHCGDICLVVRQSPPGSRLPGAVVTVLTRGGMSDVARSKRNSSRAARTWRNGKKSKMPRRHVQSPEPTLE